MLQGIDMHPIADEMIAQEKFRQTGLRADPMKRLYFAQLHSEPDWAKPSHGSARCSGKSENFPTVPDVFRGSRSRP